MYVQTFVLSFLLTELNVSPKGIFGVASGGAPNFVALCSLIACVGFGVGGK